MNGLSFEIKKTLLILFSIPSFVLGVWVLSQVTSFRGENYSFLVRGKYIRSSARLPDAYAVQPADDVNYTEEDVTQDLYKMIQRGDILQVERNPGLITPKHVTLVRSNFFVGQCDVWDFALIWRIFFALVLIFTLIAPIMYGQPFIKNWMIKAVIIVDSIVIGSCALISFIMKIIP